MRPSLISVSRCSSLVALFAVISPGLELLASPAS